MTLGDVERDYLWRIVNELDKHYHWLEVAQATTDEGRSYILLSQPAEAPGGLLETFIQQCELSGGWEVRSPLGVIAYDPLSLWKALRAFLAYVNGGMVTIQKRTLA